MAQQTAVDFLVKELRIEMGYGRELTKSDQRVFDEIIEEAKAMEKEQLKKAYYTDAVSRPLGVFTSLTPVLKTFENYYNETYNK